MFTKINKTTNVECKKESWKEWTKPEKVRSNDDDREAFMTYR